MADQAPSPATAEGGGQEVVEQDPKTAGGAQAEGGSAEDQGAPGEVAPEPERKPRQRKERLPGVVSRGDGDDIFPDLGYKSKSGKRVSREQAMREVDEEMKAEHGQSPFDIPEPPEGAEKQPEDEAPKPQKFKFGDKEYDSLEQAEQSFRSLQGMFKPMQERLTSAEQLAEKAAESARAWRARAIELEGGGQVAPTPQRPVPPESGQQGRDPKADLEAALANVNGELFESLAREHGLPLAGRYLAAQVLATVNDQMLPRLRQEIMDQLAPELEPLKQDRGFQQATQHVASLITQVSEYKNADGSDAFPELSDEKTVFEIGDLWRSMDMPAEVALTPKGLLQAIALYRMYNGTQPRQAVSTSTGVEVSRPTTTAPPTAGQSLEAGTAPSPVRGRNADPNAMFGRSLDDAPLVDPILGFSVRRRR